VSIRVLIADDQALVRAGFRKILEADSEIEVVAEAADGLEAVEAARRLAPDLVLMDIRMPELDGLEATRRLLDGDGQRTRVLILTTFGLDEYVYEALRAGASGFLLKDAPPEHLLWAIHVIDRGDALLDPSITRAVVEEFARRPLRTDLAGKLEDLTAREREVLELLARGLSNGEIAATFVVSEGTVKTHVASVLRKLGLRDRIQAVIYAYESGLVEPGAASSPP
jgi:DNA-binding NarL/FixJ family response regulator